MKLRVKESLKHSAHEKETPTLTLRDFLPKRPTLLPHVSWASAALGEENQNEPAGFPSTC